MNVLVLVGRGGLARGLGSLGVCAAAAVTLGACAPRQVSDQLPSTATYSLSTEDPLQQYAEDMGVTMDHVEVIREVDPAEQMVALSQCLGADGWAVSLTAEGQVVADIPREQESAYQGAKARCLAMYPVADRYLEPWGDREYGLLYDQWVGTTIPCLRDLGYQPEDPPARSTFIASMVAGHPEYFVNTAVDPDIQADVVAGRWPSVAHVWRQVCPYDPPEDLLYGE